MAKVRERSRGKPPVKAAPKSKEADVREKNAGRRRYIELTYRLIEYKIMYYYPELIAEAYQEHLTVSDETYDAMEMEYLRLCKSLGYKNTVAHKEYASIGEVPGPGMNEVDFTRPTVHLVLRKWGIKNWQDRCAMLDAQVARKIKADTAAFLESIGE